MSQPQNSTNENTIKGNLRQEQRKATLVNGRQWLYLQNRYNLTPRERQIAELVCQGFRNSDIARKLGIKAGTTKTHIRNIYRKVRVKSKIAMLLKFVDDSSELFV